MDSETLRQRAQRFHLATEEAFRVVASEYDLRLSEDGTGYLVFESPLVRMLACTHRGEIDVGFALLSDVTDRRAVNLWLSQVLRLTAPDVLPACPVAERSDLEVQMREIAEQVASFCQPVLRGEAGAVHAIKALIEEDAIAYTRRVSREFD